MFLEEMSMGWFRAGSGSEHYYIGVDRDGAGSGRVLIQSVLEDPDGYGALAHSSPGGRFCGRRAQMTAQVKMEQVEGWAGLWMRVNARTSETTALDDRSEGLLAGTRDWETREVVLDIPDGTVQVTFGILLSGSGALWVENFRLVILGEGDPDPGSGLDSWGWPGSAHLN